MGGYTVLTSSIRIITARQAGMKRLIDICGGIVGMILTCIITIFLAPAIYFASPGPIFFSQMRVGKNGKRFKIYKFRSMYMDAEERKKELMKQNEMKEMCIRDSWTAMVVIMDIHLRQTLIRKSIFVK